MTKLMQYAEVFDCMSDLLQCKWIVSHGSVLDSLLFIYILMIYVMYK